MAFREKLSWVTLAGMILAYGTYFALYAHAARDGEPPVVQMLALFGIVTVAQAVIVAAASIFIAVTAVKDAKRPADERDRAIARRGAGIAYYVLMVGMILVGIVMPFSEPGPRIINAALLALVLAEAVRHGLIISSYRRGWHG